ncbi:hypothetical protein K437DRAFT_99777 [Tilletiaria anomala UBC 951]|uniref:Uncharacterized protein n=1 Tax=Tilletiaria anomala (strain ATCC 24038 / CBS 436.72 / UBC 951) TaxID=1037660 RepID=A0A066W0X5_TILAU|nr:uncharacterized protein K437DRAFT_99777 [Tilletiaria anomala UBC 951]KDN47346.1 hypothetical protein K437DRAFT_99777 [Tilletiaria anomala UBC 951]
MLRASGYASPDGSAMTRRGFAPKPVLHHEVISTMGSPRAERSKGHGSRYREKLAKSDAEVIDTVSKVFDTGLSKHTLASDAVMTHSRSSKSSKSKSDDKAIPSFPSSREILGPWCVFETNLSKYHFEGFFNKAGKWRRRNVIFTKTQSDAFTAQRNCEDSEVLLQSLQEAYIHVLKDDKKELERLRITAKSKIGVVDKGLRHPGPRFHLSIVGQVRGTPPVAEWAFSIDHEQELRQLRDMMQNTVDSLGAAEKLFAGERPLCSPPSTVCSPQIHLSLFSSHYPTLAAEEAAVTETTTATVPVARVKHPSASASQPNRLSYPKYGSQNQENLGAYNLSRPRDVILTQPTNNPKVRKMSGNESALPSLSNSRCESSYERNILSTQGSLQLPASIIDINVLLRNTSLEDDTESLSSFEIGSTLGMSDSLLGRHNNSSTDSLQSTASCPTLTQTHSKPAFSSTSSGLPAASDISFGRKYSSKPAPLTSVSSQTSASPDWAPSQFSNTFDSRSQASPKDNSYKAECRNALSATEQLLYSLEDVLSPAASTSSALSPLPVTTPKSFMYPRDAFSLMSELSDQPELNSKVMRAKAGARTEAPPALCCDDAFQDLIAPAKKQAPTMLTPDSLPSPRPDSPTDPMSPNSEDENHHQKKSDSPWTQTDTVDIIGSLRQITLVDDSAFSFEGKEEEPAEVTTTVADLVHGSELQWAQRSTPPASFALPALTNKGALGHMAYHHELGPPVRQASDDILRSPSAFSKVVDWLPLLPRSSVDDEQNASRKGSFPYPQVQRSVAASPPLLQRGKHGSLPPPLWLERLQSDNKVANLTKPSPPFSTHQAPTKLHRSSNTPTPTPTPTSAISNISTSTASSGSTITPPGSAKAVVSSISPGSTMVDAPAWSKLPTPSLQQQSQWQQREAESRTSSFRAGGTMPDSPARTRMPSPGLPPPQPLTALPVTPTSASVQAAGQQNSGSTASATSPRAAALFSSTSSVLKSKRSSSSVISNSSSTATCSSSTCSSGTCSSSTSSMIAAGGAVLGTRSSASSLGSGSGSAFVNAGASEKEQQQFLRSVSVRQRVMDYAKKFDYASSAALPVEAKEMIRRSSDS